MEVSMMNEALEVTLQGRTEPMAETPAPRRVRRYRKRVSFKHLPRTAIAVKGLWNSASEEEKHLAHQRCVTMLELWLGRVSKDEAMERLSVPALRLWQMSQSALSGMLAGLLKQPRTRGERTAEMDPQSDPKRTAKRILALERENEILKSLVTLLRGLPVNRDVKIDSESLAVLEGDRRAGKKRRRAARAAGSATGSGPLADPAGKAAARAAREGRELSAHDDTDPARVEKARKERRGGGEAAAGGTPPAQS